MIFFCARFCMFRNGRKIDGILSIGNNFGIRFTKFRHIIETSISTSHGPVETWLERRLSIFFFFQCSGLLVSILNHFPYLLVYFSHLSKPVWSGRMFTQVNLKLRQSITVFDHTFITLRRLHPVSYSRLLLNLNYGVLFNYAIRRAYSRLTWPQWNW